VGLYVIYYRSTANGIEIVRVLHGARDVERRF
jgi:plasmid stabilization system protein ParE